MSDLEETASNVRRLGARARADGSDPPPPSPHSGSPSPARSFSSRPATAPVVSFDRHELGHILRLYGRKVAAGEWRDYALDFTAERAIFSVFRRTSEVPLYRIEKDPALARKQGAYSVVAATGMILRRGNDLERVIAVLDKKVRLVAT